MRKGDGMGNQTCWWLLWKHPRRKTRQHSVRSTYVSSSVCMFLRVCWCVLFSGKVGTSHSRWFESSWKSLSESVGERNETLDSICPSTSVSVSEAWRRAVSVTDAVVASMLTNCSLLSSHPELPVVPPSPEADWSKPLSTRANSSEIEIQRPHEVLPMNNLLVCDDRHKQEPLNTSNCLKV